MSVETLQTKYPVFAKGEFGKHLLSETVPLRYEGEVRQYVWSARLSTGILGKLDCKSGNNPHAPKTGNDLILAVGSEGLSKLIDLGFIPCPTCHPENRPNFWGQAEQSIKRNYPLLKDIHEFADKSIVPFDARRVEWEVLAPYLTALPNRLYMPEGLNENELEEIKNRFTRLGFSLPPVGYYVNGAPWFREYEIR